MTEPTPSRDPADSDTLVQAERLWRYFGDTCAVRSVSFTLQRGDVLGFLGLNGAGKTTTMQMLTANLAPTRGAVTIDGLDLFDQPRAAKSRLGYLPERPPLYRELTVDEYLGFCARLNAIPRARRGSAVARAKQRCGLASMGRRLIANLSQGYQQRLGIAQAIVHNPPVVVLDEPTTSLDPVQIREIRQLIGELGADHGVILSTHILQEVQAVCNRVQIIHEGRLVFSESMAHLDRRRKATGLQVAFARPPAAETLQWLPGVESVETLEPGRFRLHCAAHAVLEETLVERSVAEGWGLRELTPERRSLEQVFVELTQREMATESGDGEAA